MNKITPSANNFPKNFTVSVLGLGYVGLPLAVAFAQHFQVIAFDINSKRIKELREGNDRTGEVDPTEVLSCSAHFTDDPSELAKADVIIVAVPTPIDVHRNPDLRPMLAASKTVGSYMRKGAVVVYESTVYPGATEEECIPVLEKYSGLLFGQHFTVGYSPERINPGDKIHTLKSIVKIVSGSDAPTCDLLAELYGTIIEAGIHKASSIKIAEAAKVIENTQRDLNIALMNELSLIFERMQIDTAEVLEAAGTKWNFLPFRPGLVGGHCIGVDPYYLTYKAESIGYHPQVILAGRRINDGMGKHVAEACIKGLILKERRVKGAKVGVLGLTFKENVPDLRNTRVIDVVNELMEYGVLPIIHDPHADTEEAYHEYGVSLSPIEEFQELDALILTVAHSAFRNLTPEKLRTFFASPDDAFVLDVKGMLNNRAIRDAGLSVWRL